MKRFPIQSGLTISWAAAERAYKTYVGLYGTQQSLERLAERGGFGLHEYVWLWNGGRDRSMMPREETIVSALVDGDVRTTESRKDKP